MQMTFPGLAIGAPKCSDVPASSTSPFDLLSGKERKLLDLYYADKIDAGKFAEEHRRITLQLTTLQNQITANDLDQKLRDEAVEKFNRVAAVLADLNLEQIWAAASPESVQVSRRLPFLEERMESWENNQPGRRGIHRS